MGFNLAGAALTGCTKTINFASGRNETKLKPNIVVIYADDMGWGDVGYHGFKDIYTPNIDNLAAGGVQFRNGYVSSSICAPSRAGLLTGVYQQRFGFYGNFDQAGIPANQPMLSEMLKQHGYTCGAIGKWHLNETGHPNDRGFDFYYGFLGGSHSYYNSDVSAVNKPWLSPILRNKDPEASVQSSNGYLTEMFSKEAIGFIERVNNNESFFLYLAYNAVHHPWEVPDSYVKRLKDLPVHHNDRRVFAAMTLAMDDGVGQVVNALRKKGVLENTIIFFIGDNGSPRGQGIEKPVVDRNKDRGQTTMSSTAHLRGFKGDTYEGGIRIPFTIYWPGQIKAGKIYDHPVINLDVAPTVMARLGNKTTSGFAFDGVDLMPFLKGQKAENQRPHDILYWRRDNDYAIRYNDWKLEWNDQGSARRIMLFNLAEDESEYHDLSKKYPDKAQALQNMFDAWDSTLPLDPVGRNPENRNLGYATGNRRDVSKFNKKLHSKEL